MVEENILSKEVALILLSSIVLIPLLIGLWYIARNAIKDVRELEHQNDSNCTSNLK